MIRVLICILMFSTWTLNVSGAQKKKSTKQKQAQASAQGEGQKATVGEVMQRLSQEDRGRSVQIEKAQTVVPKSEDVLGKFKQEQQAVMEVIKPPKNTKLMTSDDSDQAQLEQVTDQQIAEMVKLLKKFEGSKNRGEFWLRLAELFVEKAALVDARAQAKFDDELKEYSEKRRAQKPVLDTSEKDEYHKKAIKLYEFFMRDFPTDKKVDQALYFLGFNYFELGDVNKGSAYLQQLIKNFPKSPYVIEAEFSLGEYYFENEKWREALRHYDIVTASNNVKLKSFAYYKTSWCMFRLGRIDKAIANMKKIVEVRNQPDDEKGGRKLRFEKEAIRDLVVFYGESGQTKEAINFYRTVVPKSARTYIEKLASYYSGKGNRKEAVETFRYLIREQPMGPKSFDYQYEIVMNFFNASNDKEFKNELYNWINSYDRRGPWAQANANNRELMEKAYKVRESTLKSYTLQQHQTAQNSKGAHSQAAALEGYNLYLQKFGDSPNAGDMRYYYAELLYDMKKYPEAAQQYLIVVEQFPNNKFYTASILNAVLALEKDLPTDEELRKKVGTGLNRAEFDVRVDRFAKAAALFVAKQPNHEKISDIKFRLGRLHYLHNHFDEAIAVFKDIVNKYPKSKNAEYSANLLLDIYNLKGDYAGLEKMGQELLSNQELANSGVGGDIKNVVEKANFKRGQDLEKAGDYVGSAKQFEAFALKNPGSPLMLTAFVNAAINYEKGNKLKEATAVHMKILELKISSKDEAAKSAKIKSRRIACKLFNDVAMYPEAANQYQIAAYEAADSPLASSLFFNAAILFEALGNTKNAIANYNEYIKRVKDRNEQGETVLKIADIYLKNQQYTKAIDQYQLFLSKFQGKPDTIVEVHYRISEVYKKMGRPNEVRSWEQKTLAIQQKLAPNKKGPGSSYAAKIKFQKVLQNFDEMKRVKIPADPRKQAAALQKKMEMMGQLNKDLKDIIQYDSAEEIVGALALTGMANQNLVDMFTSAPLPPGLTPDEAQQYKAMIEKQAMPYRKNAFDGFSSAVKRSRELEVYNQWYTASAQALTQMDPAFGDRGEIPLQFRMIDWMGL